MKNTLFLVLILFLVLPSLTPWLPHEAVHALHAHQAKHHGAESYGHDAANELAVHHAIQLDAVTYFSDYLHVDLQSPERAVLKHPRLDTQDIVIPAAIIDSIPRYALASVQSRSSPDTRRQRPDKTPIYLSTQRLRI